MEDDHAGTYHFRPSNLHIPGFGYGILGEGTQGKMSFPQIVASCQAPPCSRSEIRVNLGISSISDLKKKLAKRLIAGIG